MAATVGIEATAGTDGWSVTGSFSLSAGAEGTVGTRDQGSDGPTDRRTRASLFFFTLGGCAESPL